MDLTVLNMYTDNINMKKCIVIIFMAVSLSPNSNVSLLKE